MKRYRTRRGVQLDLISHAIVIRGDRFLLTPLEFKLVEKLMSTKYPVDFKCLHLYMWGKGYFGLDTRLRSLVCAIRKKVGKNFLYTSSRGYGIY